MKVEDTEKIVSKHTTTRRDFLRILGAGAATLGDIGMAQSTQREQTKTEYFVHYG